MARAASDGITVAGEPATRTRVATRVRWPALLPPVMTAAMSLALADVAPAQTTGAAATGVLAAAERSLASGALGRIEIAAACGGDQPYREVRVFGSGAGIWKRSVQFAAPRDLLAALLAAYRVADFEHMPETFGGNAAAEDVRRGPRIICQTRLTAGTTTKEVVQLEKGTQSQPFKKLVNAILDLSSNRAVNGITASSLAEGLGSIAESRLAPDTLDLTVHHRPRASGRDGTDGWILHIDGGTATADDYGGSPGSRRRVALRLSSSEVVALVRTLLEHNAATLPGNIYAAGYTDVHLAVLDRTREFQAREFSGLTPEARARGQAEFERLLAVFTTLHQRVAAEGSPVP